jgi:hypothetical protein
MGLRFVKNRELTNRRPAKGVSLVNLHGFRDRMAEMKD